MKISRIKIKDFHQFKDLTVDLTYPKGHKKEGQPLDKVCFIGQSGTGKTSLLELIPKLLVNYNTQFVSKLGEKSIADKTEMSFSFGYDGEYTTDVSIKEKKKESETYITRTWGNYEYKKSDIEFKEILSFFRDTWLNDIATKLIYFPASLNFDIDLDDSQTLDARSIIDFSKEKVSTVWNIILEKIQFYQEQELQIRQEILRTVERADNDIETIKKALSKLEEWKKTEFNPIQDIADNCLDKLLAPFKLKVKTELDIKSKDDIGFIKIKDYSGNEIPNGLWSTGTKQVVLTALPLYLLKPKHTVILYDEPERSLYPDLQRLIVDYYSSLGTDCQFFYATHSPIIASNFEPWEIVELKFDVEGHIYREIYFEGENHVNNYKLNPQNMRWDDILQRIFDMENDGSILRKQKLDKLASNNVKYRKLVKQGKEDTEDAKSILSNIHLLSKELSKWE